MATLAWAEEVCFGKRPAEGLEEADFRSADKEASDSTCRSRRARDP